LVPRGNESQNHKIASHLARERGRLVGVSVNVALERAGLTLPTGDNQIQKTVVLEVTPAVANYVTSRRPQLVDPESREGSILLQLSIDNQRLT
jgi:hypothetical protein